MTAASDAFLWYLIIGGAVFHAGGLRRSWEKYFVPIANAGQQLWDKMEADLRRKEQKER